MVEELTLGLELDPPFIEIDARRGVDLLGRDVEAREIQVSRLRNPTEDRLLPSHTHAGAVDDPLENTHVLAEPWPEKRSLVVLPEPVDHEDLRWIGDLALHVQPMGKVLAHAVATERQHRHRIATHHADLSRRRCRRLASEARPEEDAV